MILFVFITTTCYEPCGSCPSCDENVTWEGYGNIKFLNTGYDGNLSKECSNPIDIEDDCGGVIHDGNVGGSGNTYEVELCNKSVIFIWMWGNFSALMLNKDWKGYFNNPSDNIKMGCSMEYFLRIYPNYQPWSGDSLANPFFNDDDMPHYFFVDYVSEHISYARFSLDKKLDWLYITGYN